MRCGKNTRWPSATRIGSAEKRLIARGHGARGAVIGGRRCLVEVCAGRNEGWVGLMLNAVKLVARGLRISV